jgi:hypothetical protein
MINWRPGIQDRLVHQFQIFPNAKLPEPALSSSHIRSAKFLAGREHSEDLEKAVRWFRRGINLSTFKVDPNVPSLASDHLKTYDKAKALS